MTASGLIFVVLGAFTALGFGLVLAAVLGVRGVPSRMVATLVLGAALIVMLAQLLSLFGSFERGPLIVGQFVALFLALGIARRRGVNPVGASRHELLAKTRNAPSEAWRHARSRPLLAASISIAGACLLAELFTGIKYAPSNWDSMTYHLTRAAYWLQFDSIAQFDGATERQAAFPINAEVLQAWTMELAGGDRLVTTVQWVAQIGCIAFAVAAARDIGFGRADALWPAVAIVAVPMVIFQAGSTQNDLTVAFFLAASLLFGIRWIRGEGSIAELVLASVAAGLAVGTKTTALVFGAAIVIAVLLAGWRAGGSPRRVASIALAVVLGVLVFGSFNYAQNVVERDSLTGAPSQSAFRVQSIGEVPGNATRVLWRQFMNVPRLDFGPIDTGISSVARAVAGSAEVTTGPAFNSFTFNIARDEHEDTAGYGLVGLLLLLPALIAGFVHWRNRIALSYAVASTLALLLGASALKYNLWIPRLGLPGVILGMPLIGYFGAHVGGRTLVLGVVLISAIPTAFMQRTKPVYSVTGNYPSSNRIDQIARLNSMEREALKKFESRVPPDARVGFIGAEDSWEYPYFGPRFDRTLVKLCSEDFKPETLDARDLDALLYSGDLRLLDEEQEYIAIGQRHALLQR